MKKRTRNRSWLPLVMAGFLTILLGASSGFAEDKAPSEKKKGEFFKELNLTAEQEAKLAEYRKQNKAEAEQSFTAMKEAREKLREELDKPTSDMAVVQNLANTIKEGQAKMVDHRIKTIVQLKEVLTPEQFQKFQEKAKEKMKSMKGKRGGHGPGMMAPPDGAGPGGPEGE